MQTSFHEKSENCKNLGSHSNIYASHPAHNFCLITLIKTVLLKRKCTLAYYVNAMDLFDTEKKSILQWCWTQQHKLTLC